jgi:hypothetical protein
MIKGVLVNDIVPLMGTKTLSMMTLSITIKNTSLNIMTRSIMAPNNVMLSVVYGVINRPITLSVDMLNVVAPRRWSFLFQF